MFYLQSHVSCKIRTKPLVALLSVLFQDVSNLWTIDSTCIMRDVCIVWFRWVAAVQMCCVICSAHGFCTLHVTCLVGLVLTTPHISPKHGSSSVAVQYNTYTPIRNIDLVFSAMCCTVVWNRLREHLTWQNQTHWFSHAYTNFTFCERTDEVIMFFNSYFSELL